MNHDLINLEISLSNDVKEYEAIKKGFNRVFSLKSDLKMRRFELDLTKKVRMASKDSII